MSSSTSNDMSPLVLNLSGSWIRRANLSHANLTGADFSDAECSFVNFRGANMKDTILTRTNLVGADLTDVINLTRGQLDEAILDQTTKLPNYLVDQTPVS